MLPLIMAGTLVCIGAGIAWAESSQSYIIACGPHLDHMVIAELDYALRVYAADHDQKLPLAENWLEAIAGDSTDEGIFTSDDSSLNGLTIAFNANLSGASLPDIPMPHEVPVLFVSTLEEPGQSGGLEDVAFDETNWTYASTADGDFGHEFRDWLEEYNWSPGFILASAEVTP